MFAYPLPNVFVVKAFDIAHTDFENHKLIIQCKNTFNYRGYFCNWTTRPKNPVVVSILQPVIGYIIQSMFNTFILRRLSKILTPTCSSLYLIIAILFDVLDS